MGLTFVSCIGDHDIDGAEMRFRILYEGSDIFFFCHIRHKACGLSLGCVQLGKQGVDLGLPGGREGYLRALRKKCLNDGCADAAGAACDKYDFVF